MIEFSLILILSSPYGNIDRYIVIWLAIIVLGSALLFTAIRFVLAVIADRKWNRESHTAEEHLDRWAFLAGYSKEDLEPEVGPEQVVERPFVTHYEGVTDTDAQTEQWAVEKIK